jgi:glycosyltransferase involved in cell wall biosynthesis
VAPEQDSVVAPATADLMKGSDLAREAAQLAGAGIVFSTDLSKDLERAAVFLYITRSEGLGSAALLAMAHGVPVIASRVEGLMEVVQDGKTGLLVENTPRAIGAAIRRLLDHADVAARMGRAARDRAESLFSVDRMVEETIRVYEKVRP